MPLTTEQWAALFKVLADGNRLKILGLLAHQPLSVEEIAACLRITPATVSHHLRQLRTAELVEARALQYYSIYSLRAKGLRQMSEFLAAPIEQLRQTVPLPDLDRYAAPVLKTYLIRGRLKALPTQVVKRLVILRRLAAEFEDGKRYTEKRIDELLARFYSDPATLRRELVEAGLLAREGGAYWQVAAGATHPPGEPRE